MTVPSDSEEVDESPPTLIEEQEGPSPTPLGKSPSWLRRCLFCSLLPAVVPSPVVTATIKKTLRPYLRTYVKNLQCKSIVRKENRKLRILFPRTCKTYIDYINNDQKFRRYCLLTLKLNKQVVAALAQFFVIHKL